MKRSLKAILTLFFVLCILVLTESLHAWWSQPNDMHFKLITLSESKLKTGGLFNNNTLKIASSCPDGHNKSLEHKDPIRIKLNFCATVGMALTKKKSSDPINKCYDQCQPVIDCMGRTFHYLEDHADSTHADNYIEDSRKHAYNRFLKIKWDPSLGQQVQHYNRDIARYNTNAVVHYNAVVKYIEDTTSSLKKDLRTANNTKKGITRDTERDNVFVKNFALIEAGQDKLIDLYKMELKANASGICFDTPAYCKGLEKQIDQACQEKNPTKVKSYIQLAKKAIALNDPACKDLKNLTNNEKRKLQECSGPVTIPPGHTAAPVTPATRQWFVWHRCDAKGGWWCDLWLQEDTEVHLKQREKKITILGKYQTKADAIRQTCKSLSNIRRGGEFAHGPLANIRGGTFMVY